jgi:hypothetical protein
VQSWWRNTPVYSYSYMAVLLAVEAARSKRGVTWHKMRTLCASVCPWNIIYYAFGWVCELKYWQYLSTCTRSRFHRSFSGLFLIRLNIEVRPCFRVWQTCGRRWDTSHTLGSREQGLCPLVTNPVTRGGLSIPFRFSSTMV